MPPSFWLLVSPYFGMGWLYTHRQKKGGEHTMTMTCLLPSPLS
jgi:hypothetical protein